MMFMMPMPPTISETPATQPSNVRNEEVVDLRADDIFLGADVEIQRGQTEISLALASKMVICWLT